MSILLVLAAICLTSTSAQRGPLYDYVHKPDPNHGYQEIAKYEFEGVTAYVLNMTSQQWLNETYTDRSIWWHYLTISVPDNLRFTGDALVFLSTGSNRNSIPTINTKHVRDMVVYTNRTGIVTGLLRQVPNQPLSFLQDEIEDISEDAIIAYTWRWFMDAEEKNPEWLLRWPMCKAGARAMDTVTSFMKELNPDTDIQKFMLGGLSKRGWTAWLLAAVDDRVNALVPTVLSCLNIQKNFHHYFRSKGGWPFALGNYWVEGIMSYLDYPVTRELEKMVDPYDYRFNLTMPKLMINGASDEFFMMDDYDYFFDDLVGEKYIWLMEKTGHSADSGPLKEDFWKNMETFHLSVILDHPKPIYSWYRNTTSTGGSVTFVTQEAFSNLTAWAAITPESVMPRRDFRLKMLDETEIVVDTGIEWNEYPVEDLGNGEYRASFENPGIDRFLAFYIKARFPWEEEGRELIFTSEANIIPAEFPFPDCYKDSCQSYLL